MNLLAIDPGNEKSAYVVIRSGYPDFDGKMRPPTLLGFEILPNRDLLARLSVLAAGARGPIEGLAIEMIASYGMAVGREVFETCVWIGRFAERWNAATGTEAVRVVRREVKLHLCGNNRAKDANVRAALLDLYGGDKVAKGLKATPGPLYGVSKDVWAALALAVTYDANYLHLGKPVADATAKTDGAA